MDWKNYEQLFSISIILLIIIATLVFIYRIIVISNYSINKKKLLKFEKCFLPTTTFYGYKNFYAIYINENRKKIAILSENLPPIILDFKDLKNVTVTIPSHNIKSETNKTIRSSRKAGISVNTSRKKQEEIKFITKIDLTIFTHNVDYSFIKIECFNPKKMFFFQKKMVNNTNNIYNICYVKAQQMKNSLLNIIDRNNTNKYYKYNKYNK